MSSEDLPPYFNISPDKALSALDHPTGTDGFASIAAACQRGRDDLAGRGMDETGHKTLRQFSTWEITKYLIPVAPAHFRRVLRQNPDLPQGRSETEAGPSGSRWTRFCVCGPISAPKDQRRKNTCPIAPPDNPRKSSLWPISRVGSVKPAPAPIWRCQRRWMATRC